MKKIIITLSLMAMLVFSLPALDYSVYKGGFEDFATEVAKALPFNAAIGLNWSDAYIGSFPHFGVGITVGVTAIPYDAMKPAFDVMGASLGSEMDFLKTWGAPFPAYTIEGRVGGLILPFDVGVKLGLLPDDVKVLMPYPMDYLMVGGDVRYRVVKSRGLLPEVSFGVGYTMLNGGITLPGVLGEQVIDLGFDLPASAGGNEYVKLTDPDLNFNWQSHVIDFKIQASKKLLIITPSVGLGLAYGTSSAGGGAESGIEGDGVGDRFEGGAGLAQGQGGVLGPAGRLQAPEAEKEVAARGMGVLRQERAEPRRHLLRLARTDGAQEPVQPGQLRRSGRLRRRARRGLTRPNRGGRRRTRPKPWGPNLRRTHGRGGGGWR